MTKEPQTCPIDGLIVDEIKEHSKEKHATLRRYIEMTATPRSQYTNGSGGATYLDLFCASGRARVVQTGEWIDGSPIIAYNIARLASSKGKHSNYAHFNNIYINDIDTQKAEACCRRLQAAGFPNPQVTHQTALDAAKLFTKNANRFGLNFAFLDPYGLEQLDFEIISTLLEFKRMDLLIHFSVMDANRNYDRLIAGEHKGFDSFAPGWRGHVNIKKSKDEVILAIIEYWKGLINTINATANNEYHLVTGDNNQPLYALMLVARHKLAHKLWQAIDKGQRELF